VDIFGFIILNVLYVVCDTSCLSLAVSCVEVHPLLCPTFSGKYVIKFISPRYSHLKSYLCKLDLLVNSPNRMGWCSGNRVQKMPGYSLRWLAVLTEAS
jgi:hypothetical protein